MTSDLLTQLQEYGRQLDAEAMPLPSARAVPLSPPRRALLHRPWAVAGLAAIATLVLIGAATLLLRSDDARVSDEPASSTTVLETPTSVVETPTTLAAVPPPTVAFDDTGRWQATQLSEPWTGDVIDVASLPNGGFVVANTTGVLWSPDGIEWIDADPQRQVTAATPRSAETRGHVPAVISAMGGRVVVLDGIDPGLWVGDLQAGAWESIRFDTADLAGQVEPFAVASNDTEVIVLAEHRPEATSQRQEPLFRSAGRGYLVWAVNPQTGELERHPLSFTWENPDGEVRLVEEFSPGAVAWVNDRWVVVLANTVLVSGDGATWTQEPLEDTFNAHLWVTSLAASPIGVVATSESKHHVWFSEDGLKWENTGTEAPHLAEPAYADGLGFLIVDGETHQVSASHDGRTWHAKTWHFAGSDSSWSRYADDGDIGFGIQNLATSGRTVFVDHAEGAFLLTYG